MRWEILLTGLTLAGFALAGSHDSLRDPREIHLRNIRQLTFGGENAEAYFSSDGKRLIFQSTREGHEADQIYIMHVDGTDVRLVSTGKGRCTCAYFYDHNRRILFSSTHDFDPKAPPPPDRSKGYVWAVYPTYEIYTARPDGTDLKRMTSNNAYDAEMTVAPDGRHAVFTSDRDGDLDIYTMDLKTGKTRRLTRTLGYDGGSFYSYDGRQIVYRAFHPKTKEAIEDYRDLLSRHLIRPTSLEIFVMDANGEHSRQITHLKAASFCPFFFPDGKRIIFSSNMEDPKGRKFELYSIRTDGTRLERITYSQDFNGFPMFSPDGKKLVWASNRNARARGETNLFIADWVE